MAYKSFDERLKAMNDRFAKDDVTEEEVNSWLKQAQETATNYKSGDTSKYTTTYGSESSSTVKTLLDKADAVWNYLYNHKDEYKDADKLRSQFSALRGGLTRINSHIDGVNEYYSRWETEGDYNGWIMTNTGDKNDTDSVQKRQNAYTSVNNRITQIDNELSNWKRETKKKWAYNDNGQPYLTYESTPTNKEEYEKLVAEKERLQTYVRQYELWNKDKDAVFAENASKEDYEKKSANRDFGNSTYDDFNEFDTYVNGGYIINNDTGEQTRVDPSLEYDQEGEEAKLVINDPLGFYLDYDSERTEWEENTYHIPDIIGKSGDAQSVLQKGVMSAWCNLKDDEIQMYYYILNDQGQESAMAFLEGLESELHYRGSEEFKKYLAEASAMDKIFYTVISIPANIIGGGIAAADDALHLVTGREVDPYNNAHALLNSANDIRSVTAEEFNEMTKNGEFLGMTAGDVYQSLMSGADSFVGASMFGPAYMGFMVAGAASSGVKDLYESGASTGQIISGAVINGAAEWLGEKIPLDNFLKMKGSTKGLRDLITKTLLQGGYELGGEMITEITNIVGEAINLRSESEWAKLLEENDGAFLETIGELAKDRVWKAGAGGFISGMLMGGTQTTADYAQNQPVLKAEGQSILENGGVYALKNLAFDIAGEQKGISNFANKMALKSQANKVSSEVYEGEGLGGRISAAVKNSRNAKRVGKLSATIQEAISSKNISEITSDLRKGGMTKGEATKIANEFMSVVENGGEFSTELQTAIDKSLDDGTALGKTWASVSGKDSSVIARGNRYNLARQGIEVDTKGELTEEGAKAVTKKMNDKLGITGTVETEAEEFEVNPDGENIAMSSGNAVESLAFVDTDDGIKIKVSDTESVSASDVSYKDGGTAVIFSAITSLGADASASNEIASMFGGITDVKQARAIGSDMALAYKYGMYNYGESYLKKLNSLTPQQAKVIYNKGREQAILHRDAEGAKVKSAVEESKKGKKTDKNTAKKVGNLVLAKDISTDAERRTDIQNANLLVADAMSKVTGTEIYVGQSTLGRDGRRTWTLADGTEVGANGLYLPGRIYLDINAGAKGEGIMVESLGHELGHHIKRYNPTAFAKIADYLMEQFEANGHDVRGMIQDEIRKIEAREARLKAEAKRNGETYEAKTADEIEAEAHEEFVCQAFVGMLQDGTVAKTLADLKQNDYSVWKVIMDAIKDLLDKWGLVIKEYEGRELSTAEGQALASMKDVFKNVQQMYIEALQGANENFEAIGISIDTDTNSVSPMFSERTWTESEYVQERDKAAWAIKTSLGVDIKTAYKYIDDVNSVARLIADDRARLDYDPNIDDSASVLKPNSEYKWSVDMSTLCAKRLLFTGTFDAIQRALPNTVFDSEDIVGLREMMQKRRLEVACGICYVESTRREIGRITQEFIDRYKVAQKSGKPISRINSKGEEVVLKSGGRTFSADKSYTPNLGERNTTDIDLVKRDHREVYDAYLAFMNARGQAKPKLLETRAEYKGEILKHFARKDSVERMNNRGGLRLQSFSDFEVPHLIDMMQVVMDMSRVGLKSQAYTKVPAFAEAFGNTGVKINLSLIAKDSGLDADGNLIFDDVEGINHKEAFRLRDKFSKNVGTILVGKNDAHIIAAMADPRIDFIIPFHKSSWKESLYDALGLTGYDDYTDYQNEKAIDGSSIKNYDPSEYWDFSKSGDENAQIYLQKCREDGRIPKFPQFQGYPGYWKLLIDFKMYDNNGVGSPQQVVQPIFDNATNEKILNEYKGGHRNLPVAKDVVDDFVKQYKAENKNARFQERDSDGNGATFNGKPFWSGSVSLLDGVIEEVHSFQEAEAADFHHSMYFSDSQVEKMSNGDNAFFFVENGKVYGDWRKSVPKGIIKKIEGQIIKNKDIRYQEREKVSHAVDSAIKNKGELGEKYNQVKISSFPIDISDMVSSASEGRIDLAKKHIAVSGSDVWHEFIRHNDVETESDRQQLAFTAETIKDAIMAIYNPDFVESVFSTSENPTQRQSFAYAKKSPNGYYIVVEAVGGRRNPNVVPVMILQFKESKWNEMIRAGKTLGELLYENDKEKLHSLDVVFNKKNRVTAAQFAFKKAIANTLRSPRSDDIVTQPSHKSQEGNSVVKQSISSAKTSIKQIPALFKHKDVVFGKTNIDIGGGKFDLATNYLAERGTKNYVFDPYNRGEAENSDTLAFLQSGKKADTATCANVLNVIAESGARANVILEVAKSIKADGTAYFMVYEGDSSGNGRETSSGWQNNRKTADYVAEIATYFDDVERKGKLIVAKKPVKKLPKAMWEISPGKGVRFQERDLANRDYSYDTLVNKPDIPITIVAFSAPQKRSDVVSIAKKNAAKIGKTNNDGSVSVFVKDIGTDVLVGTDGLKHGLNRGKGLSKNDTAIVTLDIGEILMNSVRINEMNPTKGNAKFVYVLMGAATNANGDLYLVRSTVNNYTNELDTVDVLYAINAKKQGLVANNSPRSTAKPLSVTNPTISIADLLDLVKQYFPDVLPESVLRHYGYTERPEGDFGKNVLFQERESAHSNRTLLANALLSVAQSAEEKQRLNEYKSKIRLIEGEQKKLDEINQQMTEIMFSTGKRSAETQKKLDDLRTDARLTASRINSYDRRLLELEAMSSIKNVLKREKDAVRKRERKRANEALAELRKEKNAKLDAVIKRNQESRKSAVEKRHRTVIRNKIKSVVADLNHLLLHGTKERNVKLGLQETVRSALAAADKIFAEESGENIAQCLGALHSAYADLRLSEDEIAKSVYNDYVDKRLMALRNAIGDTPFSELGKPTLQEIYDAYKMVKHMVTSANRLFRRGRVEYIQDHAAAVVGEILSVAKPRNERIAIVGKPMDKVNEFVFQDQKPVYVFDRIGSETFSRLYWDAVEAEGVYARDIEEAGDFLKKQREQYHYEDWDLNETHSFKLEDGKWFHLNIPQMMSIYAYSKREQAYDHMTQGGFMFEGYETYKEDGKKLARMQSSAKRYAVSEEVIHKIIDTLSADQKAYAEKMQEYLSAVMGAKGNSVSRELYGIDLFKESFYFPLKSSRDFLSSVNEALQQTQTQASLKNTGMAKETVPHANNPIILQGFDDVWLSHVDKMSQYHALVLPIENLQKVFNYKEVSEDGMNQISVKNTLADVFGYGAERYLNDYIKDLNGGVMDSGYKSPMMSFFSKFKKAAVGASLSTVVQQPTAVIRAMSMIRPDFFVPFLHGNKTVNVTKLYDELKEYAPIAIIKEMGGFDTGSSRQAKDYIGVTEYHGLKSKAKGFFKDKAYRNSSMDNVFMWGASAADKLGWVHIWSAVKKEVASTSKHKVGTEEYFKECGKRFTEVITYTQVYDSVNSRSGLMRSKNDLNKFATSFMGEPTTSVNMLFNAVLQAKRATKGNRAKAVGKSARIIGSVIVSSLAASAMASLIYAFRDDDEDEALLEKWAEQFASKATSELFIPNMIPYLRDLVSLAQGWDVERPDMSIFADIKAAYNKLSRDGVSTYKKIEEFAGSIASAFGLPLKNVMKDARGIYNAVRGIFDDVKPTDVGGAFVRGLTGKDYSKTDKLYDSIMRGDEGRLKVIRKGYDDDKAYENAVRKALRENDPRIKLAAKARYEGNTAEYMRIARQIIAEGNFVQDTVVAAINAEVSKLKPDSEGSISAPPLFTTADYYKAIVYGDTSTAEIVKDELVAEKVAEGYTEAEAENSVASGFVSQAKTSYMEGILPKSKAIDLIDTYGGDADGESKVKEWDFETKTGYTWGQRDNAYRLGVISRNELISYIKDIEGKDSDQALNEVRAIEFKTEYPEYADISSSTIAKFYTPIEDYGNYSLEDTGMDIETYAEYARQYKDCKGVDSDGDGAADRGSKKAQVMAVIDSLPLTNQQKDALYFLNGWSASTIWQAPWH